MKITKGSKKDEIFEAYENSEKEKNDMMSNMKKMMEQMESMREEMKAQSNQPVTITQEKARVKSIKLMSLSIGQCYLVDGALSARFNKAFDQVPLRETVFQDFFYRFRDWFEDLEIIILDDEVAEEYGMKQLYDKHGISETFMKDIIKIENTDVMISKISSMTPKLQLVFVKYFASEAAKNSEYTKDSNKHYALQDFIHDKFKFEINIKEISEQIK